MSINKFEIQTSHQAASLYTLNCTLSDKLSVNGLLSENGCYLKMVSHALTATLLHEDHSLYLLDILSWGSSRLTSRFRV